MEYDVNEVRKFVAKNVLGQSASSRIFPLFVLVASIDVRRCVFSAIVRQD